MRLLKIENGFSLVEILVSIFISSVGLLGFAALQGASLKYNHNAYVRSQAILLAYDMADRIRANRSGAENDQYDIINTPIISHSCNEDDTDPGSVPSPGGCTPDQMAEYDAYRWRNDVSTYLPSGIGTVDGDGTNFDITVNWQDKGVAGNEAQTFVLAVR